MTKYVQLQHYSTQIEAMMMPIILHRDEVGKTIIKQKKHRANVIFHKCNRINS